MKDIKNNEIDKENDTKKNSDYFSKYGMIFRALRTAQDKTLEEIGEDNYHVVYLHQIEKGSRLPTLINFIGLCKSYDIEPSEFMKISEEAYDKDLCFKEILLLCLKYVGKKSSQNKQLLTNKEINEKLGLILKSMRIAQGKDLGDIAKEIHVSLAAISNIENNKRTVRIETFKNYIKFFEMPDEDFNLLYNLVITKNLTYPQILYYCLVYDIERQKKLNLENKENQQTSNQ